MSKNRLGTIKKLEKLAAWHRMKADQAGADWVWEARLRTADDLERRAAEMRMQLTDNQDRAENVEVKPYSTDPGSKRNFDGLLDDV